MNDITDKEKSAICIKCQACCKQVYFKLHPSDLSGIGFYRIRGLDVRIHAGHAYIIIPQVCQHLTKRGCGIYAMRPASCILFDGRRDPLLPEICKWPVITKEEEERT